MPEQPSEPSVTVAREADRVDSAYNIKIGLPAVEINVLVPYADLDRLKLVRTTPWISGALAIGTSAGETAWWAVDDEEEPPTLAILVGHDDETWDIGVTLPLEVLDEVLREVERERLQ